MVGTIANSKGTATFSPDMTYLVVINGDYPYITIYKHNGEEYIKLYNPIDKLSDSIPTDSIFNANGDYLTIMYDNSPYSSLYKRNGYLFNIV